MPLTPRSRPARKGPGQTPGPAPFPACSGSIRVLSRSARLRSLPEKVVNDPGIDLRIGRVLAAFERRVVVDLDHAAVTVGGLEVHAVEAVPDCIAGGDPQPDHLFRGRLRRNALNPAEDQVPVDRVLDLEGRVRNGILADIEELAV